MIFNQLTDSIRTASESLRSSAGKAINQFLTVRNWLVGYYIIKFEQQGEDRAKYGEKLLQSLANELKDESLSYRNLRLYRQFFQTYPQIALEIPDFLQKNNLFRILQMLIVQSDNSIWQSVIAKSNNPIWQSLIAKFQNTDIQNIDILQSQISESDNANNPIGQSVIAQLQNDVNPIWQSVIAKFQNTEIQDVKIGQSVIAQFNPEEIIVEPKRLLTELSYTHLVQLFPIKNRLKRAFYEIECINGCWSVRELQRQIETICYERCGMSITPEKLIEKIRTNAETTDINDIIKSPFTFEFLGMKAKDVIEESDIETALINQIQEFLLELGYGFCFEARQKRILIDGEYFFCDLVFYHRVLKCHILIDLKNKKFTHENISQLNTYVSFYKENMRKTGDNEPIGILLCTDKSDELVKYATAGMDNKLFVSQYLIELPKNEDWERFIKQLK